MDHHDRALSHSPPTSREQTYTTGRTRSARSWPFRRTSQDVDYEQVKVPRPQRSED
jgi:hypothetical protein